MKRKNKKEEKIHLTDHFTYQIIDNVIYLFEETKSPKEELKIVFKKVALLIEDEDISYINISAKNIEDRKKYYMDLGFSLSYYSVDKLNTLYKEKRDKKAYRCYAVMTKNDFLNIGKKENKEEEKVVIKTNNKISNKGFINSMILLFGGIIFLCYLCVKGAIMVIELGR